VIVDELPFRTTFNLLKGGESMRNAIKVLIVGMVTLALGGSSHAQTQSGGPAADKKVEQKADNQTTKDADAGKAKAKPKTKDKSKKSAKKTKKTADKTDDKTADKNAETTEKKSK